MLPSFEGAKIYYGFKFNTKEPPIEKILEPINQQIDETIEKIGGKSKKISEINEKHQECRASLLTYVHFTLL